MPELPHGTVTFLFTDIEASTRLWQDHPDVMPAVYARHDSILRDAVAAHGGVVFKTIGDAFQIAFPTAPAAVAASWTAQHGLQAEPWTLPEPLRVRMALHTGAVDPDPDGDYRSPVLNRLGRLLMAGHGEQVLLSQATMELCRDQLPSGTDLRDLGEQRLKDLYRPERIYQLAGEGLLANFPAPRTLDARPNNLVAQPNPLIGREAEVTALRALLERKHVRLVTLTGPGGTGKTRLSLHVAAELLDAFPAGVFVVELAAISDPDLVPGAIAQVLRVKQVPGTPIITTLAQHFEQRHLLLVLDNLEQVIGVASFVGDLLAACPTVKILVTSRIRLNLRGEHEYPVTPLDLPDLQHLPRLDVL
ncbi:MAG: adenylate/guanylate cyclase domain-containing protein, partial [Chloroflexota bacterium]|nr:adenylate/guanylate cyclase domain-containing protein [Chloroflexota bacterium]